jgi:hypothetical protein
MKFCPHFLHFITSVGEKNFSTHVYKNLLNYCELHENQHNGGHTSVMGENGVPLMCTPWKE